MAGRRGNSEFCFPETLNVPHRFASGNIELEGKQISQLPAGPVIKCFALPPYLKMDKNAMKSFALPPAGS